MAKEQLVWLNVDPSEIKDPEAKKTYLAWQKGQETFENAFIAAARKSKSIEDGETLKFSYRYGKIGVAKVAKGSSGSAGGTFNI